MHSRGTSGASFCFEMQMIVFFTFSVVHTRDIVCLSSPHLPARLLPSLLKLSSLLATTYISSLTVTFRMAFFGRHPLAVPATRTTRPARRRPQQTDSVCPLQFATQASMSLSPQPSSQTVSALCKLITLSFSPVCHRHGRKRILNEYIYIYVCV